MLTKLSCQFLAYCSAAATLLGRLASLCPDIPRDDQTPGNGKLCVNWGLAPVMPSAKAVCLIVVAHDRLLPLLCLTGSSLLGRLATPGQDIECDYDNFGIGKLYVNWGPDPVTPPAGFDMDEFKAVPQVTDAELQQKVAGGGPAVAMLVLHGWVSQCLGQCQGHESHPHGRLHCSCCMPCCPAFSRIGRATRTRCSGV